MQSTTKKLADALVSTPSGMLEKEILRRLVSHDENVGVKAEDDFLSEQKLCGEKIDGNQCIRLLYNCINKSSTMCGIQWARLNWGAGIDWENMDYGAASKLAKKLKLDTDSVDTVVAKLSRGARDQKTASETLKMSLQAIKNRISPSPLNVKPIAPSVQGANVMPRTSVVSMSKMNMTGGGKSFLGQNCSYANFIRCLDNVKNNISMRGGGNEHADILRSGLTELQTLLQHRNKTIHKDDLVRINDLIDTLERTEKRLNVLGLNIWALNAALKENSVNIPDDKKEITLKIIEQLVDESNKIKLSSDNKITNIVEIFEKLDSIVKKLDSI